jgi:hypothetical protein
MGVAAMIAQLAVFAAQKAASAGAGAGSIQITTGDMTGESTNQHGGQVSHRTEENSQGMGSLIMGQASCQEQNSYQEPCRGGEGNRQQNERNGSGDHIESGSDDETMDET